MARQVSRSLLPPWFLNYYRPWFAVWLCTNHFLSLGLHHLGDPSALKNLILDFSLSNSSVIVSQERWSGAEEGEVEAFLLCWGCVGCSGSSLFFFLSSFPLKKKIFFLNQKVILNLKWGATKSHTPQISHATISCGERAEFLILIVLSHGPPKRGATHSILPLLPWVTKLKNTWLWPFAAARAAFWKPVPLKLTHRCDSAWLSC